MIALDPPFRRAVSADGPALARLVNFAGEGLPLHLWRGMAAPGEDPWAVGAARQAAKAESGGVVVVDEGHGAVASMTGYPIGSEPEPVDGLPPLLRPLQALENKALDSWYLNILAVMPERRGSGLGSALLGIAERVAAAEGRRRVSLIVADDNVGARRFYARAGYAETAAAPVVRDGWETAAKDWLLLIKELDRGDGT